MEVAATSTRQLPRVARAGTVPTELRFEEHHVLVTFGQPQGGHHAAEDSDVAGEVFGRCREDI